MGGLGESCWHGEGVRGTSGNVSPWKDSTLVSRDDCLAGAKSTRNQPDEIRCVNHKQPPANFVRQTIDPPGKATDEKRRCHASSANGLSGTSTNTRVKSSHLAHMDVFPGTEPNSVSRFVSGVAQWALRSD